MFPQIFGKYILEREIGSGGMARVYQGTLRGAGGFEKRLVVKQIRPELASDTAFVQRFVEEAKTAVELSHPNIVPVFELGVEQGVYYIAMEFCEGVTLAELLRSTGPLSAAECAHIGVEICTALDYAHRRAKIVHRDVTPRNVLVDDEGAVKLIDFGIAAPVSDGECAEVFGSPGHMPPEQLRGASLSPATDVFAVGVLLWEVWTGQPPYRRKSKDETRDLLRQGPPELDPPSPKAQRLAEIVRGASSPDIDARPQTAERLARALRETLRDHDVGDVARSLGARVAGATSSVVTAPGPTGDATPPLSQSDRGPQSTRTFAVREELQVATRALTAEESSRSEAVVTTSRHQATGVSSRWRLAAALTGGIAIAATVSAYWPKSSAPVPALAPSVVTTATSTATTSGSVPSELVQPSAVPSAPRPPPVAPTRTAPSAASPHPSASAKAVSGRGKVVFTSVPPTTVSIGGRQMQTPGSIELPAGSHSITFTHAALHESRSASVKVPPGGSRSVHADFTGATPRIVVR